MKQGMCVYTFRTGVDETTSNEDRTLLAVTNRQLELRNKAGNHEKLQRFAGCILPRTKTQGSQTET